MTFKAFLHKVRSRSCPMEYF